MTLAQTSVGGHQEIGAVERANGTVQTLLQRVLERENHSRNMVVSMDVVTFCLDVGALSVRPKNETDPI